jgi:iron complex outermembrane receptor protein
VAASAASPDPAAVFPLPPYEVAGLPWDDPAGMPALTVNLTAPAPPAALRQALAPLPGLLLQDSFGGFDPPRLSVRGSGLQSAPSSRGVLLFLDQSPLSFADGSFNSALLDLALTGQATLRRGTRPGLPALGGGLYFSTPDPAGRDALQIGAEAGSRGAWRFAADASLATAARLAFSLSGDDGWRAQSAQRRANAFLTWAQPLAQGGEAGAGLFYARPRIEVPGPLTMAAAIASPRAASAAVLRDRPYRDTEYTRLHGGLRLAHGDDGFDRFGWSLARVDDYFRQLRPNGISTVAGHDLTLNWDGARFGRLFDRDNRLRWSILGMAGSRQAERWRNDSGHAGARIGEHRLRATTAYASIDDTLWLTPRLAVGGGATLQHYRRTVLDRAAQGGIPSVADPTARVPPIHGGTAAVPSGGTLVEADVEGVRLLPRLELHAIASGSLALFAAWSRGAEPPAFDDLLFTAGDPNAPVLATRPLGDQTARTLEAGLRGAPTLHLGGWTIPAHWELTAYRGNWRNELLRLADATGAALGTVNAGRTLHQGVETALRLRLWQGQGQALDAWLAHTWTQCRFAGDPQHGRNRLGGVPPHLGGGGIAYTLGERLFVAPEWNWVAGKTFADHGNQLAYGGHVLTHLRIGLGPWRGWRLQAQVTNLFDRHAIASTAGVLDLARNPAATAIFLPTTGRAWRVGLSRGW